MAEIATATEPRLLSWVVDYRPATVPKVGRRRMAVAIGASALAHGIVMLLALLVVRPAAVVKEPIVIFPVSLIGQPGAPGAGRGGGGDGAIAEPAPPPPPPAPSEPARTAEPERPVEKPIAKPVEKPVAKKPVSKPAPVARPKPAEKAATESARSDGASPPSEGTGVGDVASLGRGTGPGSGGGGGGGTSASPAYGSNPQPPYPMAARRLHLQGTVVLRVVVAPDGRPTSVSVLESSGHEVLDASALETVRRRWRFVPARRNGIAIEDSVQVPIRFRETAG